jgi:pimeloyl-ACP methyl ester carboxylesterase
VAGTTWEYLALGEANATILFLHGMAGAYDIWWQQIEALQSRYRVLSVTYPPVQSLAALCHGIIAILDQEQVTGVNVVGTSLGGYLTQYMLTRHAHYVRRVVLGNTFPPNPIIAHNTRHIGRLLPLLPLWMIMRRLRQQVHKAIYPAAGRSELVRAYLLEQSYGLMSKAQFVGRYRCVVEPFTPPDLQVLGLPTAIIEADNDPLVAPLLREHLQAAYPAARVYSLHGVGHFPYLNTPDVYTQIIERFVGECDAAPSA